MSSFIVRFPDGTKEFRYPEGGLKAGDHVWHDGQRYRVISVDSAPDGRQGAIVEADSDGLVDLLSSEEGALHLEAIG